jgi:hypothetical protein
MKEVTEMEVAKTENFVILGGCIAVTVLFAFS